MRAAGCVINDYADRSFDGEVARTKNRPLAAGDISSTQALVCFACLLSLAACLLFFLNDFTRALAIIGVLIAIIYPFSKRWTHLPQLVLGAAFSWGIIMAFASTENTIKDAGWVMFGASFLWITGYDTLYAMVDRDDDLKIGVKSTAILFGPADKLVVGILQLLTLASFIIFGLLMEYGWMFYSGLTLVSGCFVYQQWLIQKRESHKCFKAFSNNVWVGFIIFLAIVSETTL